MTFLNFWVLGEIDFRLHILGATVAFLAASALLLYFCTPTSSTQQRLLAILPALLVMMTPQYGDGMLWTTTAVQGFFCNLCAVIALILLERPGRTSFVMAMIAASIGVITQGNGLCIFAAGLGLLGAQYRWRSLIGWVCIAAVVIGLNVYFFVKPSEPPPLSETILQIPSVVGYGLAFLGSPLGFDNMVGAVIAGVFICILTIELFRRGLFVKAPALAGIILFLLFTAGLNSIVRYKLGIEYAAQAQRYRIVSVTLLACCYLGAQHVLLLRSQRVFYSVMALACIYWVTSFLYCKESLRSHRELLISELGSWCTTGAGLTFPYHDMSDAIMTKAIQEKIYDPASVFRSLGAMVKIDEKDSVIELPSNPRMARRLLYNIDAVHRTGDQVVITGWVVEKKEQSEDWTFSLLLRDNEGTVRRYSSERIVRKDVVEHLKTDAARLSGFLVAVDLPRPRPPEGIRNTTGTDEIDQGPEIGFEVVSSRGTKRYMTGRKMVAGEPNSLLSRCFR
jgi:hypothetical protein